MGAPVSGAHATAMVNGNAVHALGCARLVSHRCPDRWLFDMLNAATTDGPAAVTDAAEMARGFNAPGGIAHTSADSIAERATAAATTSRRGCDAFH